MATFISKQIAAKAVETAFAKAEGLGLSSNAAVVSFMKGSLIHDLDTLSLLSLLAHDLAEQLDPVEIHRVMKTDKVAAERFSTLQKASQHAQEQKLTGALMKTATAQAQAFERDPRNRPTMDLSKVEMGTPRGLRG